MKKSILKFGNTLNKAEQKTINGGTKFYCPNGSRALVGLCQGGELVGYCTSGTISLGSCL